jgi:hypothetical protein
MKRPCLPADECATAQAAMTRMIQGLKALRDGADTLVSQHEEIARLTAGKK